MRRILTTLYAGLGYLAFLLPIGYLVGFLADAFVPKSVDRGAGPFGPSLWIDPGLLAAFGLQHSIMARPGFKRWLRRWISDGLERSTYVLASGLTLSAVFWLWRPIPLVVWDVTGTWWETVSWMGFAAGWGLAVWSTFALSHLYLFGVSQAVAYASGSEHPRLALRDSRLYTIVRHPMTAGLLLAFWSTPRMTLGHAVFAAGMTVYSLLATVLEERDLLREFPRRYRDYTARVPALLPLLRPGWTLPRRHGFVVECALVAGLTSLPFLALGVTSLEPPEPDPASPPMASHEMVVSGRLRSFDLYDPTPPDEEEPRGHHALAIPEAVGGDGPGNGRALVLAFHGSGGDGARFRGFLGGELERAAGQRGWMVAYPEAIGGVWNDCRQRAGAAPRAQGIDDVAFVHALVERLARERGVDPSRVFVLGYSGGGHMALRLVLEAPWSVRGAAVFGASLPRHPERVCEPRGTGAPLILVNGTRDAVSPFEGGDVIAPTGRHLGDVLSSPDAVRYLRDRGGADLDVRLVPIEGGGHVVPGPGSRFPEAAGATVRSWAGVEGALEFFDEQLHSEPPQTQRASAGGTP